VRLAIGLLVVVAIAGCGSSGGSPSDDPLPSGVAVDVAPPDVVLTRYLDALVAGDCERTRSFVAPTFVKGTGELCGALDVSAFTPLSDPARPSETEYAYSTTLTTSGDGASIPAGNQIWFYHLIRQADGQWLISGGGSGP
jgi:hypothetical protein